MSELLGGSEVALKKAKDQGLVVVYPEPNQLQLDIDSTADLAVLADGLELLVTQYGHPQYIVTTPSQGKGHYHTTITFEKHVVFTPETRFILQAGLGSDRKREFLGYFCHLRQDEHPTLLLEPPRGTEKAGDVRENGKDYHVV